MKYIFLRFPEGKFKAVTLSYDDGQYHDVRLAQTLDKYGIKAPSKLMLWKFVNWVKKGDIVIVNKVKLNASHFSQLPKLRLVCVSATGYDNVNIDDAQLYL